MKRLALACALAIGCAGLSGCGLPAAVVWTTVGSGLGFGAAALKLDDDLLRLYEKQKGIEP